MAGKSRDIKDFFKPYARSKRRLSSGEDLLGRPPHEASRPHVLLPPSPSRPRKLPFTASAKLQRESSPSFGSSPLSDPPPDLLSDDVEPGAGICRGSEQSDTSPEAAPTGGAKSGPAVVRNSDDDDTSSQSSLADLDQLLRGFTKPKPIALPASPDDVDKNRVNMIGIDTHTMPRKNSTQSKFGGGSQLGLKGGLASTKSIPKYSFSLRDLVTQTERDEADEMGVAKAKSMIDSSSQARQRRPITQRGIEDGFNKASFTAVVTENDDGYNMQRVIDAMKRTEAFDQELMWSFFKDSGPPPEDLTDYLEDDYDFPNEVLSSHGWTSCLIDRETRTRAFLSGFVAEKAASGRIPQEILQWTLEKVSAEAREDLRYAYIAVIKNMPSALIPKIFQKDLVDGLLCRLNAKPEALEPATEIVLQLLAATDDRRDWSKLLAVLDLLGSVANELDESTREHTFHLLLRLSVDAEAMSNLKVSRATEETIAAFASSFPDREADDILLRVCKVVFLSMPHSSLRRLLLRHLYPCTPRMGTFRCRLALAFFFNDDTLLDLPSDGLFSVIRVNQYLRKRRLVLDGSTDYTELASLAYMLDVAIDKGIPTASPLDRAQEKAFNREVDAAAERIKTMFTAMADSGASHLKRSEAKDTFEALYYRLVYAVRTGPPPKLDIFGDGGADDVVRSGGFMQRFLAGRESERGEVGAGKAKVGSDE